MIVILTSVLQLLIFFLLNLSITLWGTFKSLKIMVDLSTSSCSSISFLPYVLLDAYTFKSWRDVHPPAEQGSGKVFYQSRSLWWKTRAYFTGIMLSPLFHEGFLVIYHEDTMVILKAKLRELWHPHKAIALGCPHSSASPHSTSNNSSKLILLCS